MYVLAGLHIFLLMESINQPLTGRTTILKLLPFSYNKMKNGNNEVDLLQYVNRKQNAYRIKSGATLSPNLIL